MESARVLEHPLAPALSPRPIRNILSDDIAHLLDVHPLRRINTVFADFEVLKLDGDHGREHRLELLGCVLVRQ